MTETYSEQGPKCPHCQRQFTADEAHYYEPRYTEEKCDECGHKFNVEVNVTASWTCSTIEPG